MKKMQTYHIVILITTLVLTVVFFITISVLQDNFKNQLIEVNEEVSSDKLNENDKEDDKKVNSKEKQNFESHNMKSSSNPILNKQDLKFTKDEIEKLDSIIKKYGEGVSVYFEDIESNNMYIYNGDEKYFIASLVKAPYCMYLYQLANDGKCDLNQKLSFEEKHKQEGTGKLNEMITPAELTVQELITYSIRYSDNTAMKILLEKYPYKGYTEYAKKLGINYIEDVKYVVNGDICAKDAGVYIKAIYNFIETNKYGEKLKEDMMATRHPMIKTKYPIARKYGWAKESFHDFGVVYAPHHYVIAICTDKDDGNQENYRIFYELPAILEKMQNEKYENIN